MKKLLLLLSMYLLTLGNSVWAENERGEAIYNQSCSTCHSPEMVTMFTDALGEYNAPPAHDTQAWRAEFWEELEELWEDGHIVLPADITSLDQLDIDYDPMLWDAEYYDPVMQHLIDTVIAGKGLMTAGGACADCSYDDYRAAIEFMMSPTN